MIYSPIITIVKTKLYDEYWTRIQNPMTQASTLICYFYAFNDTFFNPDIQSLEELEKTINKISVDASEVPDSLNIVYVIGESFGKHRSNIYGYPLVTNPYMTKLQKKGVLFSFNNIITNSNQTIEVLRHLLSTHNLESNKNFESYPLLPALMKKAGYKVAYYDNQSLVGNFKKVDFGCTYFFCRPEILNKSVDKLNNDIYNYDEPFINGNMVDTISNLNFTIYHLMGQHTDYKKRYPEEFEYFKKSDYKAIHNYTDQQAQTMAEYDNATLYNDYILNLIVEKLRNQKAIMIYAPDHGEEVYDYRNYRGRQVMACNPAIAKTTFEVPVFIWFSNSFIESYPDRIKNMKANINKALYNADLVHTILDISGIKTDYYIPELSLFNSSEGRTNRVIKGFEYDKHRQEVDKVHLWYN